MASIIRVLKYLILFYVLGATLGAMWSYATNSFEGYSAYIPLLDEIIVGVIIWGPLAAIIGLIVGIFMVARDSAES